MYFSKSKIDVGQSTLHRHDLKKLVYFSRNTMVNQFWNNPEIVRSFIRDENLPFTMRELAGFYDGDGSFYLAQRQAGANVTQCYYATLRMIQRVFGGNIDKRTRSNNQRHQYALTMRNMEMCVLVPSIKDHLILKAGQADRVLEYMSYYNRTDKESQDARKKLTEFDPADDHKPFDRINKEYIRGLFCAEGCLRLYSLTLCQKGCIQLLEHIKAYVEKDIGVSLGKINEKELVITDHKNMKLFLDWMTVGMPRLFHEEKALQIDTFYKYLETRDIWYKDMLGAVKHENFEISNDILKAENNVAKEFTAKLRSVALGRVVKPNKPRAPPMSSDQRMRVVELRNSGKTFPAIAMDMGCPLDQVKNVYKTEMKRNKTTA